MGLSWRFLNPSADADGTDPLEPDHPMRILQICSAREIGGGERHLADLANNLATRGHEIFAAIAPGSPLRSELSSLAAENIIELPMRNALSVRSGLRLARLVRERRIEIVHAHVARDYPLAALAAGRSGARLVLTRHVLFPLSKIHRLTLRRTSRVIAVSEAVADGLRAQNIFPAGQNYYDSQWNRRETLRAGKTVARASRP